MKTTEVTSKGRLTPFSPQLSNKLCTTTTTPLQRTLKIPLLVSVIYDDDDDVYDDNYVDYDNDNDDNRVIIIISIVYIYIHI